MIDVTLFFIFLAYSIISWAVNRNKTHSYDFDPDLNYSVYQIFWINYKDPGA